jgi:hypothetical protein
MEQEYHPNGLLAEPATDEAGAPDPYDLDRLRLTGNPADSIGIKKALITVPVRKPRAQEFFRTCDDPEYQMDAAILRTETDGETYIVSPEIAAAMPDEIKYVRLTTCVNRQGDPFLWPVPLPDEHGRDNDWYSSARTIAKEAASNWCRMKSNRTGGYYDCFFFGSSLR